MNSSHDEQHDWNPKWNANYVVKRIAGKIIWKIWFENPAIYKIQSDAKQKQRVCKITKPHKLVSAGNVQHGNNYGNKESADERRAKT